MYKWISAIVFGVCLWLSGGQAEAAAPLRTEAWCTSVGLTCTGGLAYDEAAKCAEPEVIFCEDFKGGETFFPVTLSGTPICDADCLAAWYNPAQTGIGNGLISTYGVGNRYILPASGYPALSSTAMQNYVHVINHDPTLGRTNGYGALWIYLRDVLNHTPGGGASGVLAAMQSGHTNVKEFHFRAQFYWTWTGNGDHASFVMDGFPKPDPYNNSTSQCLGHKLVFHYTPGGTFEPAGSSTDGGIGFDCGAFDGFLTPGAGGSGARYGNALLLYPCGGPCGYERWPMGYSNVNNSTYMIYGGYQSNSLSDRPGDSLLLKRIFRVDIGRVYTIEYHVKWSDPAGAANGISEVWVNGTKIYTDNDLKNCFTTGIDSANTQRVNDNCTTFGLGAFFISDYMGGLDTTPRNGQQLMDNIVVTAGDTYIGVPGAAVDVTPPGKVQGLSIASIE